MRWKPPAALVLSLALVLAFLAVPSGQAMAASRTATPTALSLVSRSATAVAVSWKAVPGAGRYQVKYSTSKSMKKSKYRVVTSTYSEIPSLKAKKTYYIQVRVLSASGKGLSAYAAKLKVITRSKSTSYTSLAPAKLAASAVAADSATLGWSARKGAGYQVQLSTSRSFSAARSVQVTSASTRVGSLASDTTYYVRVRVVSASKAARSSWSPVLMVRTAGLVAGQARGVSLVSATPTSLTTTWEAGGSLHHLVRASKSASMSAPVSVLVAGTRATVSGLSPATVYYLTVAPANAAGGVLGRASGPLQVRTAAAGRATLRVATYNVGSHVRDKVVSSATHDQRKWSSRRDAVVAAITKQSPDVIGLQEASEAWFSSSNRTSQYTDLIERLGAPYKLTNTARYNCVNSTIPSKCDPKDQGASGGTRIAYDASKLTLVRQGSVLLEQRPGSVTDRFIAWAVFQHKASGRTFFFGSVHLEPGKDPAGKTTLRSLRKRQAAEVIAAVKKYGVGLPQYVVGDFNSHKWGDLSCEYGETGCDANPPYTAMRNAGFVDPLGNAAFTMDTTSGATVVKRINTNYSSFNGFERVARKKSWINGVYHDYIWTSKGIAVTEWETVVKVGSSGKFSGVIPSDHNMLRATTVLG